jgi:hypothetical protein
MQEKHPIAHSVNHFSKTSPGGVVALKRIFECPRLGPLIRQEFDH